MPISEEQMEIRRLASTAKYRAHDLQEQLLLAYHFIGYHDFSVNYHWKLALEKLASLASALGYRIEKIQPEKAAAEAVVITEREVYNSDFGDALSLGFSQRESQ
jgi:hypothetical protein